jgi:hypothetical protein
VAEVFEIPRRLFDAGKLIALEILLPTGRFPREPRGHWGLAASGQDLQSGHEGERNGFGPLVVCLRAERDLDHALEERVGIRLKPHDLAEPRWLASSVNAGSRSPKSSTAD